MCPTFPTLTTVNGSRQQHMARTFDYGLMTPNRAKTIDAQIPFGGLKQVDFEREGSRGQTEAFPVFKYIRVDAD